MSKAIEDWGKHEESRNLMRLADVQAEFLRRYSPMIEQDYRWEFERELLYIVQLTYREATLPLTKQLTDFVLHHSQPILVGKVNAHE